VLTDEMLDLASTIGALLRERGETIGVAEGSCGGLVSASLLSVPGASAYYVGGAVVYTGPGRRAFLGDVVEPPPGLRGATEDFARFCARSIRLQLGTTWGLGEGGATGPSGNPYGDPPGHAWLAVEGPSSATRHLLTGVDDRLANMGAFTAALLGLLLETIRSS
jgi:nicotinamide-nucleotide amidase